jgi:signal transduction histidine kinase
MLLIVSFAAVGSLQLQSQNLRRLTLIQIPAVGANGRVLQAMIDARTGLTGYQLSGDRALLEPYYGAHYRTMTALATLQVDFMQEAGGGADTALHKGLLDSQRLAAEQWFANAVSTEQALSRGERTDPSEGLALFRRFRGANRALGEYLTTERDQSRLAALAMSSRGEAISFAATLAALLAMLVLGHLLARSISEPLTELRDTMVRQREGEPGARAREDQGSSELRSVAADFNALSEQNLALQQSQARALGTHQITFEIARAIRAASDTQQALEVMCAALGEGLGVDRVIASAMDVDDTVLLGAQWHRLDLPSLGDLTLLPELGGPAEELWLSTDFRAPDLLEAEVHSQERNRIFYRRTGARAVIMVPIGFDDRVIGMIYVLMVRQSRLWTTSETNVVQAVAGFVARAIVEAEHQAHQGEYVERIERLDRQKSDFLATVSHELRTPLTSITGYLELLQEGDAGEMTGQQHGMLEVIRRNTGRLRSLIEDVLVLSRIEGGVNKANFVEVSIRGLVTRVGEELSLLALRSAIELQIDAGPPAAVVLGETASLERAVVNILANAIKFSHPGGVVTVTGTLDQDAGRVRITCQDHGVGIPADDQGDLFTRFYRASNATDQAIPGTGLGLSIAKQIVEDHHGGVLRLISVEDEGTTVIMDLPLYEPEQTPGTVRNDSHSADVFDIRA